MLADILRALDTGDLVVLTLLDFSAAFDMVDHATLLRRLEVSYGLRGHVLGWFQSYLDGHTQYVRRGTSSSTVTFRLCGVPQGSVLEPILSVLYMADLLWLVNKHQLCPHLYADDTQMYGSCHPSAPSQLQERVSACVDEVALLMWSNWLQLNTSKTEVLWCASSRHQHRIPRTPSRVSFDIIQPASSVRDLGFYLDANASMRMYLSRTVSNCFAVLHQIQSIPRSLTRPVLQSLVISLVIPRLDYGNEILAGLPDNQLSRLQSALKAAARLIFSTRKYEAVSPLLCDLHWL